jgi:hypothetical protein
MIHALRDIAEECDKSELERALGLCSGFADQVCRKFADATESLDPPWQATASKCSGLPN